MKKNTLYLILLLVMILFTSCSEKKAPINKLEKTTETEKKIEKKEPKKEIEKKKEKTPREIYEKLEKGEVYSKLNGAKVDEKVIGIRPLAVMFDNHPDARPQSSLDSADIVYEVLVEGQFTRYMAVFQSQKPMHIGPIRSARPYFLRYALEYDALYTHVGGSEQAKSDIKTFKMADVDAMASGSETFWREHHRKAPHNMYASYSSLLNWADYLGYRKDFKLDEYKFSYDVNDTKGSLKVNDLSIEYKTSSKNDKTGYHAQYKYDEKTDTYMRYVNSKAHIDETSKKQLYASSVIIQRANTNVIDDYGRLAIDNVGEGKGYYAHAGKLNEIIWKKKDLSDKTRYYNMQGDELVLYPGKLWIQVVPKSLKLKEVNDLGSEKFEALFTR